MELLNLLLYAIIFLQLSYTNFFNFCLINIFLKYCYYNEPIYIQHSFDFSAFIITIIHMSLHIFFYYMDIFLKLCKQNKYYNVIICKYNNINDMYLKFRFMIFYNLVITPLFFILKKNIFDSIIIGNINNFNKIYKRKNNNLKLLNFNFKNTTNQLKSNIDIDKFLNKITLENKHKKSIIYN
jgi:hypothetical protein